MNERPTTSDVQVTLSTLPDSDIAVFRWVGPITAEDREGNLKRVAEYCNEHNLSKLLIDGRKQENRTGIMDSYTFGASVPEALKGLIVAVVHRPDDETLEFIETVAFNRGSGTKAFTNYDDALAWLEAQ